jgi:hypothetical protein
MFLCFSMIEQQSQSNFWEPFDVKNACGHHIGLTFSLYQPHNPNICPIQHPLLHATLHNMIDIICIEPKLCSYIVVAIEVFLQIFVSWLGCAMFTLSQFALQHLTFFIEHFRQSRIRTLIFQTLWLQHVGCVKHQILIMCGGFCNGCPNGLCIRAGDGVVHFGLQDENWT